MSADVMFFHAATTNEPMLRDALHRLETQLRPAWGWRSVDLAVVFFSAHFRGMANKINRHLQEIFEPAHVIGCSAEGVIGTEEELEQTPAITLLLGHLPGVHIKPFDLATNHWEEFLFDRAAFREMVGAPEDTRLFLLLGDPFSAPMDHILKAFNDVYPGVPVVGGMASAAMAPGQNALLVDELDTPVGAVGLALAGDFEVDLVTSQGCRPIGEPYAVTGARRNVILQLENQPPLFRLQELVDELPEEDRMMLQRGLLIGRAIHPMRETFGRGDFVIRSVMAANRQNGSIVVGDVIDEGEIVQFHVRDADTAREDLEMMLIPQAFRPQARGALLFSCNGRGTRLFDYGNGDISVVQKSLGNVPLAGFFCAGEIGPVGITNFIHGHTACLAIFRPTGSESPQAE